MHAHGNLLDSEPLSKGKGKRLWFWIIAGVASREKCERPPVRRSKSRGDIPNGLTGGSFEKGRKEADAHTPSTAGPKFTLVSHESGADTDVGLAGKDRGHDVVDVRNIMLPVAIELNSDIVAMGKRVDIARLDGSAYAEVIDKVDMRDIDFIENLRGPVRRPVVDNEKIVGGFGQAIRNRPDGFFLIIGRNNEENTPPRGSFCFGYLHAYSANSLSDIGFTFVFRCCSFSTRAALPDNRRVEKQNTSTPLCEATERAT